MKETVYIFKTSPYTLESDVEKVLNISDFQKLDPKKKTFIKINANYDRDWPGCNTSGWFLDALLRSLRRKGFKNLAVIEGDLKLQPASRTIKAIGIDRILEKYRVPFLNTEALERGSNELPVVLKKVQFISTPVLHTHTHANAIISCASKNLFGLLPIYREKYHTKLPQKILELGTRVRVFTIVDGTVGLDGGSMRLGMWKRTNLILAGWNPVAVDIVAVQIMGFSIADIPYLALAKKKDLIPALAIKGNFTQSNIPSYNFIWKKSRLAVLDLRLRENKLTGKFFEYDSFFDRLANRSRRLYISLVYRMKKRKVLEGSWKEYQKTDIEH